MALPEAIETFLGVLEPSDERAMTSWTVAGQIVSEAGPGLWVRVKRVLMPDGGEMPLHDAPVYFLRWEQVTTARLYDALPLKFGGSGSARNTTRRALLSKSALAAGR